VQYGKKPGNAIETTTKERDGIRKGGAEGGMFLTRSSSSMKGALPNSRRQFGTATKRAIKMLSELGS